MRGEITKCLACDKNHRRGSDSDAPRRQQLNPIADAEISYPFPPQTGQNALNREMLVSPRLGCVQYLEFYSNQSRESHGTIRSFRNEVFSIAIDGDKR
jgi:hypothetical protein